MSSQSKTKQNRNTDEDHQATKTSKAHQGCSSNKLIALWQENIAWSPTKVLGSTAKTETGSKRPVCAYEYKRVGNLKWERAEF